MKQLPNGWIEVKIDEINLRKSINITPNDFPEEVFELYSVPIYSTGKPENVLGKEIGSSKQIVSPDDVLLCKINPRINRVWTVGEKSNLRQIASSEWINVSNPLICANYLKYAFSRKEFRELLCSEVAGVGGSLTRAQPKKVDNYTVPLAPLAEQVRIANKLDSLLAKVDAAQARLDKIPTLLKRFRQSVLAAATSGELTKEWREINGEKVDDASLLLEQIQKERRIIWERNELRKFDSKGKTSFGDSWKKNYKIPVSLEIKDRSELPEQWMWTSIDSISSLITDGKHGDCNDESASGYFFLSAKNIVDGKLDYKNARQITKSEFDEVHFRTNLEPGDICLVNTGATVGKVAIADDNSLTNRSTFQKSVAVIKLVRPLVSEKYFYFFLMGETKKLLKNSTGSAVNNLLLSAIREFPVALPPGVEQKEIILRVESLFAQADAVEKQYHAAKQRIDRLTQSLLAKAFRGELVPQDPNDEPASELLKRIQAERQTQTTTKRPRKPRT